MLLEGFIVDWKVMKIIIGLFIGIEKEEFFKNIVLKIVKVVVF